MTYFFNKFWQLFPILERPSVKSLRIDSCSIGAEILVVSKGGVKVDLVFCLLSSLRMFEYHMIVFIGMMVLLCNVILAPTPNLKGLCLLEEHLRRLRIRRLDFRRNVVISKIDDPIQIAFRDLRLRDEVLEFSHVAIHEFFDPRLALLLLLLRHEYNGRMEVIWNQYPISGNVRV